MAVTIADFSKEQAKRTVNNHPNGRAVFFNINDENIDQMKFQMLTLYSVFTCIYAYYCCQGMLKFNKNPLQPHMFQMKF